jgi:hypothetical protein
MKTLDIFAVLQALCKASGKWGMLLTFPDWIAQKQELNSFLDDKNRLLACPFINLQQHGQCLVDGRAYILCDSEEECQKLYGQIVGDDGPTKQNPYDGWFRVYAITCSPEGELMNENT